MGRPSKVLTVVAGPNGAGKTTFVHNFYQNEWDNCIFVNADFFANQLQPKDSTRAAIPAGRLFLTEVDKIVRRKESLIIETTLSGRTILNKIIQAHSEGYVVRLVFLWISTVELWDFRVKGRIALGGHNIML